MGKSSESRRKNEPVVKSRGSTGSYAASGGNNSIKQDCLFSLKFEQKVPTLMTVIVGQYAVLLPDNSNLYLNVIIDGQSAGRYSGKMSKKVIKCISEGFVYEGKVISIKDSSLAVIEVKGRG
ncbi:MAG: hypothetical protein NTZ93_02600 [Candidatus Beckwithbacteria bacterium]|nr:hypothetical protein [Candidatus Beckwithbacteria bacterium]